MKSSSILALLTKAADGDWEELNLLGMNISELPSDVEKLTNLTTLDLRNNKLTALPVEIGKLTNLTTLDLRNNKLTTLPVEIGNLTNLTTLDLRNNKLTALPVEIEKLTNLTTLYLSANRLTNVPIGIEKLINLTTLSLSGNDLTVIPAEIRELTNLTTLHLSNNKFTVIPAEIGKLTNLTTLDVGVNRFTVIPPEIGELTSLTTLYLSDNEFTAVPSEIGKMAKLKKLHLRNNKQLTTIPSEIGHLTNLEALDLRANNLTAIPVEIGNLTELTILDLRANNITTIPVEIGRLIKLTILNLSSNNITTIPAEIGTLTSLTTLNLSANQLVAIPVEVGQSISLTNLYLSVNALTTIPTEIQSLKNLITLNLRFNALTTVPPEIGQLTSLKELHLSDNSLTSIPAEIGELSNLSILNLRYNKLTSIPAEITQLTNLKRLVLKDNPITSIPPEIIEKGWGSQEWKDGDPQVIFAYLKSTVRRPLNELKVLLVGEGDVGKTSLLKRLLGEPFNERELKTPGINIEKIPFPVRDKPIRLNLWDFGGQRVMHNTHQFFLTRRSLYLLVLDNRKNEQQNRIEYWLKLIETYGGDSPVIVVGNCSDEHPLDLKQRTLQKKYPQIKEFVATSCKTDEGIPKLRHLISQQIDDIPHVRDLLPTAWFGIKTQIEEMQADVDFISYEKYQALCHASDITTSQDQKILISFLHDLGIILNFQDDPRLQDTNVLNPEWVTSGVYDILNNHDLMVNKKGILTLPDLAKILQQIERYPSPKRPFLMGLLEKFELCFKLQGYNPERYLISDLLPIDEPDIDQYENSPLHFQYHYDLLPSSIISRFIVRNHTMIYKKMCWRSGTILSQDFSKALVRADEEDTFITIKVHGNRANALLATIRTDFQKIHDTIPNLAVREYLVIREFYNGQLTDREVPVDYNYLCALDRQDITTTPLPNMKGNYNLRDILEGVEPYDQRQHNLEGRLEKGYKGREGRKLKPLPKTQKPTLLKVSSLMLFVLAVVSAIFTIIAHLVPGFTFFVTVTAILLGFPLISIVVLRVTGIVSDKTFGKLVEQFFNVLPVLQGRQSDPTSDTSEKSELLKNSDRLK